MKKTKKAMNMLLKIVSAVSFLGIFTEPGMGQPVWKWLLWELGCIATLLLINVGISSGPDDE